MTLIGQMVRFGVVGTVGYIVDAGVLRAMISLTDFGLYSGRIVSFLAAALTTYALNKVWTFRAADDGKGTKQIVFWLGLMSLSAGVNYGVYVLCLQWGGMFLTYPELGVAVGSIIAMSLNFLSARFIVFRQAVT